MGSMNTWILFMQVLLISAGAVSLAMGISFTVPMAVNEVQVIWSIIHSWMKPPYLHILINFIIITVAASSCFRQSRQSVPPVQSQRLVSIRTPPPAYFTSFSAQPEVRTIFQATPAADNSGDRDVELKPVVVNGSEVDTEAEEETVADGEAEPEVDDAFLDRTLTYNTPSPERLSPVKPTRNIPERVRASIEGTQETLETVWRRIMEGASRVAATHEETGIAGLTRPSPDRAWDSNPKSKSFKERRADGDLPPTPTNSGIQKEISPSQDELNWRVEAFIKKVNNEIRSQRQESLDQYMS